MKLRTRRLRTRRPNVRTYAGNILRQVAVLRYTANGQKNEVHYYPIQLQPLLWYLRFATSPTRDFCIQMMMCLLAVHPKET